MPITIKQNMVKFRETGSDEFVGIDTVAETTTATQVAAINSAAATQITAIENKGTTTRASIPNDYTTLSNDVTELKSAVTDLKSGYSIELKSSDIIQGTYNGTGAVVANTKRIRNSGFIEVKAGEAIHFVPGQTTAQFLYGTFSTNKVYITESTWYNKSIDIELSADGYIIVVFANSGKTDISPSDYDADFAVLANVGREVTTLGKKVPDTIIPILRDGSPGNPGNANAVCMRDVMPIDFSYASITVAFTDKSVVADQYAFAYCLFNGASDGMTTTEAFNAQGVDKKQVNVLADSLIDTPFINIDLMDLAGYDHVSFYLWCKNNGNWISLRESSNQYCLKLIYNYIDSGDNSAKYVHKDVLNARHIPNNVATPLTLAHFSDIHQDAAALSRITSEIAKFSDSVDDIICTGDMVANTAQQIVSWWDDKILTCIGNHDTASYNSSTGYDWTALSMADRDAYYIAPFEDNWGITHTSGTSYYYKDYTTQKVRLIVMDAMLYHGTIGSEATTQTAWLSNLLSDAITNNLHVLIAIHAPVNAATIEDCTFSRYGRTQMATLTDCFTPAEVVTAVATAINNGMKFVGYIVGHNHQDYIYKPNGTQLGFCVTCAAVANQAQWIESDQYRGDEADAYNLVTINTANTLVKIVRGGGADIDDHMRTRKAICFNYSTGEKVGEVL